MHPSPTPAPSATAFTSHAAPAHTCSPNIALAFNYWRFGNGVNVAPLPIQNTINSLQATVTRDVEVFKPKVIKAK